MECGAAWRATARQAFENATARPKPDRPPTPPRGRGGPDGPPHVPWSFLRNGFEASVASGESRFSADEDVQRVRHGSRVRVGVAAGAAAAVDVADLDGPGAGRVDVAR